MTNLIKSNDKSNVPKHNYQRDLDYIIRRLERTGEVPTLLLHACCAPLQQLHHRIPVAILQDYALLLQSKHRTRRGIPPPSRRNQAVRERIQDQTSGHTHRGRIRPEKVLRCRPWAGKRTRGGQALPQMFRTSTRRSGPPRTRTERRLLHHHPHHQPHERRTGAKRSGAGAVRHLRHQAAPQRF